MPKDNSTEDKPEPTVVALDPPAEDTVQEPAEEPKTDETDQAEPETTETPETPVASEVTPDEPPAETGKKKRFSKKSLLIVAVVGINILIAVSSTALVIASKQPKPSQPQAAAPTDTASQATATDTTPTKVEEPVITQLHYTADALKSEFDYPSDWQITGNSDNTSISIHSPTTQVKDGNGQLTNAQVSIDITAKYAGSDGGLITANSVIAANSEELKYSNPTKVQRKVTHISFASIDDTNLNSVGASFISGNLVYYGGSTIGSQNFKKVNPFIIISMQKCDTGCNTNQFLSLGLSDYNNNEVIKQAKAIIKSFEFN